MHVQAVMPLAKTVAWASSSAPSSASASAATGAWPRRRASFRRARARTSSSDRARGRARATALSTSPRTSRESGSMPRSMHWPRARREPARPSPIDAIAIAWARSSQRSSTCSRPTESRSRPSGTRPSGSMRARRSISVSTPPRLVAQRASRTLSSQRPAVGAVGELEGQHAARARRASDAARARDPDGRAGRGSAPR